VVKTNGRSRAALVFSFTRMLTRNYRAVKLTNRELTQLSTKVDFRHQNDNLGAAPMRTQQLAEYLGVSTSTIKNWSTEFADFLSESASGGDGTHRYFAGRDARIMAYVADLREQNEALEEIQESLAHLQANDWTALPQMPDAPPGVKPIEMIPEQTARTALEQQRQALMREIAIREEQIDELTGQLTTERDAHDLTRTRLVEAQTHLGHLQGQLEAIETRREDERTALETERAMHQRAQDVLATERANERAALEAERNRERSTWQQERRLLLRALIVVGVVAVVLLVVIVLVALTGGFAAG
jgi:DNA-binding transcriptional MerR regulator